jgi:uncharacterized membrane protein
MARSTERASFTIELGEDELLGAHLLARMQGIAVDDLVAFHGVLRTTLRDGLAARVGAAGMCWPPTADDLELADRVGDEIVAQPAPDDASPAGAVRRRALLAAGAITVALAVVLVGGYGFGWSWTGFEGNNQLWDWMQLLLFPVALACFPLWLRFSGYMSAARRRSLATAVAAFVVFVLVGYLNPLRWTGFSGQTLWDWLTLLILPVSIVTVRVWPQSGRDVRHHHIAAATLLCAALIVTIIGGYGAGWSWTGYRGNTLWDWLTLVLGPVAITTFLVPAVVQLLTGGADARAERERARRARDQAVRAAQARIARPR